MSDYSSLTVATIRSATTSRQSILQAAEGFLSQNFPRQVTANSTIAVDGTVYLMAIGLLAGDVVSNAYVAVTVAGATVTLSKCGLYNSAGTRLALSADQGTAWQSTGLMTVPFTSAVTIPATGIYYGAVVTKASVTLPTLARCVAGVIAPPLATAIGSGALPFASLVTQTDLPTSLAVSAGTAPISYWIGLS